MSKITPTVGRIVYYHPGALTPVKTCAALIANVNDDGTLNLAAFDSLGNHFSVHNVWLIQDGEDLPAGGGYAEWMPYQKGQAAKTEQLEKQLEDRAQPASPQSLL